LRGKEGEMRIGIVNNIAPAPKISCWHHDEVTFKYQSAMSSSKRVNNIDNGGVCVVASVAVT
jgi:hypothetical protein